MRGNKRAIPAALVSAGVGVGTVLTVAGLTVAGTPGGAAPAVLTARTAQATADAASTGASGTEPVIIFLKNQWAATASRTRSGERSALIQSAQEPYLGQLRQLGATDVTSYQIVDAIAARVPKDAVGALTARGGVASVIPDAAIQGPSTGSGPASTTVDEQSATASTIKTPAGACSATPQLEPEGLALTRTASAVAHALTARSLGFTGAGVKVGFLADGIDPANANLVRGGKPVISNYADFSGDGTAAATAGGEAFLDANAIAGQGHVYNVDGFSAQSPAGSCDVKIEGAAPGASLVALKVFSRSDVSTTSALLRAIDYAVITEHVSVLNESFGTDPFPDETSLDAVKEFNDLAVKEGTTVVVAAGDAGPYNTIGSPASDPKVISVGATTDFRLYDQTNYAGADQFAPDGWESGNISSLSSGGYTQNGQTLNLVAPGDMSFSSCTPTARYSSCVNFLGQPSSVMESGGTSQAASLVAGAAALVIQAYAKSHHGIKPTPAVVKQVLTSSATNLGAPATEQGSGELNSVRAVQLAASMPGSVSAATGQNLRLSASQLNYTGKPGTKASWSVTVTNAGQSARHVAVSGRQFTAAATIRQATVKLNDAKSPHFTNAAGVKANYARLTFKVPNGAALLNASIAWPTSATAPGGANSRVQLLLVNPAGKLAADSLPQGASGYGSAQVLRPAAGTWTAVVFSDTGRAGGTTGNVRFGATVAAGKSFGTVSPSSLTLAPGASRVVEVSARTPAGAGDSSGSVVFSAGGAGGGGAGGGGAGGSGAGGAASLPVTLRGTVVLGRGVAGTFSGKLTGGNGRSPGEGQVASYTFRVPGNLPVLLRNIDVDVTLANDPQNQVSAYLVAPGGETMGYGSSYLTTSFLKNGSVPVESPRKQLSVYTSNPVPGVWTLIIDFTSPVPGNELADKFSGRIRLNAASFSRHSLPDSPAVKLKQGKAVAYKISVKNTGWAAEDIFLDPRLTALATYTLQPQNQVSDVKLPLPSGSDPPEWIVPTMTHSVAVAAKSTVPVVSDFGPFPGDPDEASTAGSTATAGYPAGHAITPVTQGLWYAVSSEVGPFGAAGARRAEVSTSMHAVTQAFDTTARSYYGDFWEFGVAPLAAQAQYRLFTVNPGETREITLTIKPTGKPGTVVRGMLYVDDFTDSLQFLSGSQIVALPYSYTISK